MITKPNSRTCGAVDFVSLMAIPLLLSGCSFFETKVQSVIEDICNKVERQETLVQKIMKKRLAIADEFRRDRSLANSRVATD
jgi:hypothetical protein